MDPDEWDEFIGKAQRKIKVLKFKDGADVFVVPESEVESVGSFSPTGATLTLRSGQEVTVDRRAGVESVEVESVEEMVRMLVNRKEKPNTVSPLTIPTKCDMLSHQKVVLCKNKKYKSGRSSGDFGSSKPQASKSRQTGRVEQRIVASVSAGTKLSAPEQCSRPEQSSPVAAGAGTVRRNSTTSMEGSVPGSTGVGLTCEDGALDTTAPQGGTTRTVASRFVDLGIPGSASETGP